MAEKMADGRWQMAESGSVSPRVLAFPMSIRYCTDRPSAIGHLPSDIG